ncbi:MAG: hypothetical protein AAF492_27435, partial [Verrucomicrobiota bacterium]
MIHFIGGVAVAVETDIADPDLLGRFGRDGKDAQFEPGVVDLFEEPGGPADRLVAVVDASGIFFFRDFAHHFLAVDPHAESADRGIFRNREGIEGFDDPVFPVSKDLNHFGGRDMMFDPDRDIMFFEVEIA